MSDLEQQVFRKVRLRLLPFLIVCYFIAYIDRVNVGFAALEMNKDLGFTPLVYGWGAGIFFIGYFLFEVPSNVALERFGARKWIARIMLTWGVISMAMALVQGQASFYTLRFLLGMAEAGFFPGIVFYLTYWFPAQQRARVIGTLMLANPIATVIGGPLSGLILSTHGVLGLQGWKWLFIIEGLPAVFFGLWVYRFLSDRPSEAKWLTPEERETLERVMERDRASRAIVHRISLWQGLANPRVLVLGLIYFGVAASNYGLSFWLPTIVKAFGVTNFQTGVISALPYACGAAAMYWWGQHSDRTGERTWHVAGPLLLTASCLAIGSQLEDPVLKMVFICLAGFGIFAVLPPYWTLPTGLMSGTAAAASIALVNSIGNLSGFAAPYMIGWIKTSTGSFSVALMALAALPFMAMVLTLAIQRAAHPPAAGPQPAAR
ncbi:MAG: MFS transporter [Anaeromyxobacter sp.]